MITLKTISQRYNGSKPLTKGAIKRIRYLLHKEAAYLICCLDEYDSSPPTIQEKMKSMKSLLDHTLFLNRSRNSDFHNVDF